VGPVRWQWPTDGKVVAGFDPAKPREQGVDIGGKLGQPIHAASGGKVVYSGSGLIGYGKLIIIKHDEQFLSAYAYNEVLYVKQGDIVHAGDLIARMGEGPHHHPRLHFEIRRDGKPVDPARYLPQR
jgi:lipoprotein NlpD